MLQQMKKFFLYLRLITSNMTSDRVFVARFDKLTPSRACLTAFVRSLKRALSERMTTFCAPEISFTLIFTSARTRNLGYKSRYLSEIATAILNTGSIKRVVLVFLAYREAKMAPVPRPATTSGTLPFICVAHS